MKKAIRLKAWQDARIVPRQAAAVYLRNSLIVNLSYILYKI